MDHNDANFTLLVVAIVAVVVVFILCCAFLGCSEGCLRILRPSREESSSVKGGRNSVMSRDAQIELYELQQRIQKGTTPGTASFELSQRYAQSMPQQVRDESKTNTLDEVEETPLAEIVVVKHQPTPELELELELELEQDESDQKKESGRQRGLSDPEEKLETSKVWADLRAMEEQRAMKEDHALMDILAGHEEVLRALRKAKFEINANKYREDKAYRAGVKVLKLAVEKFGFERVHACIHKNDHQQSNNSIVASPPQYPVSGNGFTATTRTNSFRLGSEERNGLKGLRLDVGAGRVVGIIDTFDSEFNHYENSHLNNQSQQKSEENLSEWYGRDKEYPLNKAEEIVEMIRPLDAICGMIACGPPFYFAWTKRGHGIFPLDCRLAVRTCLLIAIRQANQSNKINKQFHLSIGKGILSFQSLIKNQKNSGDMLESHKYIMDKMTNKELMAGVGKGGSDGSPLTAANIHPSSSTTHETIVIGIPLLLWIKCLEYLGFNYHEHMTSGGQLMNGVRSSSNHNHSHHGKSDHKGGNHSNSRDNGNSNSISSVNNAKHVDHGKNMNKTSTETLSRLMFQSVSDEVVGVDNHVVAHNKMMEVVEEEDDHIKGVSFSTRDGEDIDTSGRHSLRMRNMSSDVVLDFTTLKKKNSNSKIKKIAPPTTPPPPVTPSSPDKKFFTKQDNANTAMANQTSTVTPSKSLSLSNMATEVSPNQMQARLSHTVEVSSPRGGSLSYKASNPTPPPTPAVVIQSPIEKEEPSAAHVVLAFLKKAASIPNSEPQIIKLLEGDSDGSGGSDGSGDSGGVESAGVTPKGEQHRHNAHRTNQFQEFKSQGEGDPRSKAGLNPTTITAQTTCNNNSGASGATSDGNNISGNVNNTIVSDEERWLALANEWAGLAKRCLCASDPPSRNLGAQLLTTLQDVATHRQQAPPRLLTLGRGDEHRLSWLKMWQCPKCTLNNRLLEDLECPVCGLDQPEGLAHRVALRELLSQWSRNPRSSSNIASSSHSSMNGLNYSRSRTVSISTHQSTGVPSTTGSTNDGENNSGGVRSNSHSNARTVPTHHNAATRSLSSWLAANTSFFPESNQLPSTSTAPVINNLAVIHQKSMLAALSNTNISNPSLSPIPTPQPHPAPTINPIQTTQLPKITKLEKKRRTTFL